MNQLDSNAVQLVTNNVVSSNYYHIGGNEITWSYIQPKSGATFYSESGSHKYCQLFGLYTQSQVNKYSIDRTDGGLKNTMIDKIGVAYESTGMWVGNLASNTFRTALSQNMRVNIPITGGTGSLSGSQLQLYTAFVEQPDSNTTTGSGPCPINLVDELWSESHIGSTVDAGIGFAHDPGNNPSLHTGGHFRSGVMHLFTDPIEWSGATNTGTTWDTGWSAATPHTFAGKKLAKFDTNIHNKSVGIVYVDSGVVAIYDPTLVGLFNSGIATGGTSTTGLTFTYGDTGVDIKDRDTSTSVNINFTLEPNTFTSTTNLSKTDAAERGLVCDQVSITEICVYDDNNNVMAIASLDAPLEKDPNGYALLVASTSVDGGIKENYLGDGLDDTVTI